MSVAAEALADTALEPIERLDADGFARRYHGLGSEAGGELFDADYTRLAGFYSNHLTAWMEWQQHEADGIRTAFLGYARNCVAGAAAAAESNPDSQVQPPTLQEIRRLMAWPETALGEQFDTTTDGIVGTLQDAAWRFGTMASHTPVGPADVTNYVLHWRDVEGPWSKEVLDAIDGIKQHRTLQRAIASSIEAEEAASAADWLERYQPQEWSYDEGLQWLSTAQEAIDLANYNSDRWDWIVHRGRMLDPSPQWIQAVIDRDASSPELAELMKLAWVQRIANHALDEAIRDRRRGMNARRCTEQLAQIDDMCGQEVGDFARLYVRAELDERRRLAAEGKGMSRSRAGSLLAGALGLVWLGQGTSRGRHSARPSRTRLATTR